MSSPPANRYCDLVMKGGIASGAVYPHAIYKLAQDHQFKNIVDASAGAIAAAAEFQRRDKNSVAGFEIARRLPVMLKKEFAGGRRAATAFPTGVQVPPFVPILIGSLNATGTYRRVNASAGLRSPTDQHERIRYVIHLRPRDH